MGRTWEKVARIAVATVGVAGAVAGLATGNPAVVAAGIGLAGWAAPWVRELQLGTAVRDAQALLEALRHHERQSGPPVPSEQVNRTIERLRRVSKPPPSRK